MPSPNQKPSRDPERTQRRILKAALNEFSAHGYAGARVDTIARRAGTNKRMLYHYFRNKKGLLRAVLRHKIVERSNGIDGLVQAAAPEVVLWFKRNCDDSDWVRLLAWESLENKKGKVFDEAERRRYYAKWMAERIRKQQATGQYRADVDAKFLQMAQMALSMYPIAMPQVTRLITGLSPQSPKFQKQYTKFLETIVSCLRPTKQSQD